MLREKVLFYWGNISDTFQRFELINSNVTFRIWRGEWLILILREFQEINN